MNIVLHVGTMNRKGCFTSDKWIATVEWLAETCNNLRLYTHFNEQQIANFFSNDWLIEKEQFPDPSADLKGFRVWGEGLAFGKIVMHLSFDPDRGVTHCYFLKDDQYVCDLVVDDYDNFLILYLTASQEKQLLRTIPDLSENVTACQKWHDTVNDLNDGEEWKPLGASGRNKG